MFNREPALVIGAVQAAVALVVAFGLELSPEQIGAILAVTAAVLGLVTRQTVYAPKTVHEVMDAERIIASAERGAHRSG